MPLESKVNWGVNESVVVWETISDDDQILNPSRSSVDELIVAPMGSVMFAVWYGYSENEIVFCVESSENVVRMYCWACSYICKSSSSMQPAEYLIVSVPMRISQHPPEHAISSFIMQTQVLPGSQASVQFTSMGLPCE